MRTIGGGILLTLGCLLGFATIVCAAAFVGWVPLEEQPGEFGVFTLVMVALAGWTGLALVTGVLLLRRRSSRSGQWVVLTATIGGTLLGFPTYRIVEYEKPTTSTTSNELNGVNMDGSRDREEMRIRAFGTEFKVEREPRVRSTDSRGQTRLSRPTGEDAQFMALFAGIAIAYSVGGGLICGLLATLIRQLFGGRAPASHDKS